MKWAVTCTNTPFVIWSGPVYCVGLADCVIASTIHLMATGPGEFKLKDQAEKVRQSDKGKWIDYQIKDPDVMSVCEYQKVGWDHQNIPVKLSDFLQHLESKGEVKLKLANHIITRTENEGGPASFDIVPDQDCAFKLTATFPKSRSAPTLKDVGAFIDFLSSKDSTNVTWLISLTLGTQRETHVICASINSRYEQNSSAIRPGGYYMFPSRPLRIAKGQVAKLC